MADSEVNMNQEPSDCERRWGVDPLVAVIRRLSELELANRALAERVEKLESLVFRDEFDG